jgi:methanogenic corrinoid protein MtbC1
MPSRDDEIQFEQLIAEMQRSFTDALLSGNEIAAETLLRDGVEAGVPEAALDDLVITPSLRAVGDLWESGQLSIGEQHLATEIALRCVAIERDLFRLVRRRTRNVVVLAAVEGEQHVVALQMAGSLLAHAGYEVKQLGADVPSHALGIVVDRFEPSVVGLSATMPAAGVELQEAVGMVRAIAPEAGVVVGGMGVPPRLMDTPLMRRCERVTDATGIVDALTQHAAMN